MSAAGKSMKEVAGAFRFVLALQKNKIKAPQYVTRDEKLSRYTNFTLDQQFAKFENLQTLLLQKEFLLPTIGANPSIANGAYSKLVTKNGLSASHDAHHH